MKPTQPSQLYRVTAERLNLPEEYVKDLVEYFYRENKNEMGNLSHTVFNLAGLGRMIMRPFKFFNKQKNLGILVEKFKDRRDNRGIMIKKELEKRHQQFIEARPMVEELNVCKRKIMFKNERNSENKNNLEEQK